MCLVAAAELPIRLAPDQPRPGEANATVRARGCALTPTDPIARSDPRRPLARVLSAPLPVFIALLSIFLARPADADVELVLNTQGAGPGQELFTAYSAIYDPVGDRAIITSHENSQVFAVSLGSVPGIEVLMDATGDGSGNTLSGPWGAAVRDDGAIFVSGEGSDNAFRIDPGGAITQIVDVNGAGPGQNLLSPRELAVGPDGEVYIAGHGSNNVLSVSSGGSVTEIVDTAGDGLGNPLSGPMGIAVDPVSGAVYVSGHFSHNVFRIFGPVIEEVMDSSGDGMGNGLSRPWGVLVTNDRELVVAGHFSDNVFLRHTDGSIEEILDSNGNFLEPLVGPTGLAINPPDQGGELFVSAMFSDNVFVFGPIIGVLPLVRVDGDGDGQGNILVGPASVSVDDGGHILVSGTFSANVLHVDIPNISALNPGAAGLLVVALASVGSFALRRRRL